MTQSNDEWKSKLTQEQYDVLRNGATEAPYSSSLNQNKDTGIYMCAACNSELFRSDEKYNSGSGWPSFTQPINDKAIEYLEDSSHGMTRIEVRCATCHSHLGHVFPDGPGPSGQRYCINGLALDFEKREATES